MWKEIEQKTGEELLMHTGILVVGEKDAADFKSFVQTATDDVEYMEVAQIEERWPELKIGHRHDLAGMHDMKGGIVRAQKSLEIFKHLSE